MNYKEFVDLIRQVVLDSVVPDMIEQLENPSGRCPSQHVIDQSRWFLGLTDDDKGRINEVIRDAAHSSVFGFLCVLDGVRAIEDDVLKGDFLLTYRKGGEEVRLNDPEVGMLHDVLNSTS